MLLRLCGLIVLTAMINGACKPIWKSEKDSAAAESGAGGQALAQTAVLQDWSGQNDLTTGSWSFLNLE